MTRKKQRQQPGTGKSALRFPLALKPGDVLGVAAPAGPFDRELFEKGLDVLRGLGFGLHVPKGIFQKNRYLAGTDRHRAEILNRLFANPEVQGIICARGGYGSVRMIPHIDKALIRKNPKVLIGFSDVSALLTYIYRHLKTVCFHGPMVTTLATADRHSRQAFFGALTSSSPLVLRPEKASVISSGRTEGPVLASNLTVLCHLVGTPLFPDLTGHILLMEDIEEPLYKIDRMLTQLKTAGAFDGIGGLALGAFNNCGRIDSVYRIVGDVFQDREMPILGGFGVGHQRRNLTVPVGVPAVLRVDPPELRYLHGAVS